MRRNHFTIIFFFFTCAVVTVHQTGDVGFGLAGYQMWGAELFQYTVVVVLINHPLVIDPKEGEERRKEKNIYISQLLLFPEHERSGLKTLPQKYSLFRTSHTDLSRPQQSGASLLGWQRWCTARLFYHPPLQPPVYCQTNVQETQRGTETNS